MSVVGYKSRRCCIEWKRPAVPLGTSGMPGFTLSLASERAPLRPERFADRELDIAIELEHRPALRAAMTRVPVG